MRCAIQDPNHAKMVILPDGMKITKDMAAKDGFVIAKDAADACCLSEQTDAAEGTTSYFDQLQTLPEAADRPRATAKIAAAYTIKSLSLQDARGLLRGFPIETAETQPEVKAMSPGEEAVLKRKVEIRQMGQSMRGARGDPVAKDEARKLNFALQIKSMAPRESMVFALRKAGVDPTTIK